MNKVIIKKVEISNFKGIARYTHEFEEGKNKIFAENGAGKSTIKNAWEWCLCQQVDDYIPNINNEEVPDLITSVQITLESNNTEYVLYRESKGKYVTNRETGKKTKTSNENIYKLDGMEITLTNYKNNIASIIGDTAFENLIVLTDKEFFNSDTTKWKWTDRRKLLFQICDVDNAVEEIKEKEKYSCIRSHLDKGYATSDIKSMLRKDKDTIKKQQEKNLILIEQKQKEIDEYLGIDFDSISNKLGIAKMKLTKLLNSSKKENQSEILTQLQEELSETTKKINQLKTQDSLKFNGLVSVRTKWYNEAVNTRMNYDSLSCEYKNIEQELQKLVDEGPTERCPYCKNILSKEDLEQNQKKFEEVINEKTLKLAELQKEIQSLRQEYNKASEKFNIADAEQMNFKENEHIKPLEDRVLELKSLLEEQKTSKTNELLLEEKKSLEDTISSLEQELAKKEFIIKGNKQVELWKSESRDIADKIIEIEEKEIALQDFVREQTDLVCEVVNSKFSNGISWGLYTMNYVGTLEEGCVCLYNGKRYSSLSTGERNIANLEVLKVLQDYYNVNLPIFSDNSETITLPYETDRQTIELHAKKGEKLKGCIKITDLY